MNKMKKLALAAIIVASIVGCKAPQYSSQTQAAGKETKTKEADVQRIPLTVGLIQQYALTKEHLQKIQFYLEGTIVLSIDIASQSVTIEGGDLLVTNTNKLVDIEFKKIAGIFQGIEKSAIAVRFEQDGNNRYLWFAPGTDGRFYLYGATEGSGLKVKYDDRTYIADATSRMAYLSIGVRQLSEFDPQKRIAPGVRLGESSSGSGSNGVNSTSSGFVIPNGTTNQAGTGEPVFVPAPAEQSSQPAQQNPTPPSGGGGGIKGKTF